MENKMIKVKSPSGKVHWADELFKEGKVDPYCNHRQWVGDYWGKPWKKTDEPVTCGNCLSKHAREFGARTPMNIEVGDLVEVKETKQRGRVRIIDGTPPTHVNKVWVELSPGADGGYHYMRMCVQSCSDSGKPGIDTLTLNRLRPDEIRKVKE